MTISGYPSVDERFDATVAKYTIDGGQGGKGGKARLSVVAVQSRGYLP